MSLASENRLGVRLGPVGTPLQPGDGPHGRDLRHLGREVAVRDLATGQPIGAPFNRHNAGVYAVTTTQLGGRPAVISGSVDGAVRV